MAQLWLKTMLKKHSKWVSGELGGERADFHSCECFEGANLQNANLQGADFGCARLDGASFQGANLQNADVRHAYLQDTNLQYVNLQGANLQEVDLRDADFQNANLQGADLRYANLRRANLHLASLQGANLKDAYIDDSCWPLWCGSLWVKVCARIARQLAYHFCCLDCDDPAYLKVRNNPDLLDFANGFHRVLSGDFNELCIIHRHNNHQSSDDTTIVRHGKRNGNGNP